MGELSGEQIQSLLAMMPSGLSMAEPLQIAHQEPCSSQDSMSSLKGICAQEILARTSFPSWMRSMCPTSLANTCWVGDGIARRPIRSGTAAQTLRLWIIPFRFQNHLLMMLMAHALT